MARSKQSRLPAASQQSQSRSQTQSQSQSQGRSQPYSQSQRRTRDDDDDDDDGEQVNGADMDEREAEGSNVFDRNANALVRLALFNEVKRLPLRREEINRKVLGNNTRSFNHVFQLANVKLQAIFGMELVELMSRSDRDKELNSNAMAVDEENATGLKKKATASGSKSYILRSNLCPELIELANITDNALLDAELDQDPDGAELESDSDDEYAPARPCGSVLSWGTTDQVGVLGVTYVLLALILVSGRVLGDAEMKKYLKSLRLEPNSQFFLTRNSPHSTITVDALLSQLVRQGYLDKVKLNSAGGAGAGGGMPRATQGKRSRPSATADADDSTSYEWRWGSRAQSEIGEAAIGKFVGEFMAEMQVKEKMIERDARERRGGDDDDDDDEEDGGRRRQGARAGPRRVVDPEEEKQKAFETMMKGIGRAVGGKLSNVK